nr:MAG TPA: hypothetical protein [Caudoviricetes sp.]
MLHNIFSLFIPIFIKHLLFYEVLRSLLFCILNAMSGS